jgi:TubC N-terminal docking domain
MSVAKLIAELESRGILLSLANGEIRYRSPKAALSGADKDGLRARRAEIV